MIWRRCIGASCRTWTYDPLINSQMLLPAELTRHIRHTFTESPQPRLYPQSSSGLLDKHDRLLAFEFATSAARAFAQSQPERNNCNPFADTKALPLAVLLYSTYICGLMYRAVVIFFLWAFCYLGELHPFSALEPLSVSGSSKGIIAFKRFRLLWFIVRR